MNLIPTLTPLLARRLAALNARLDAAGYTGDRTLVWEGPTLLISPPDATAQAIIDAHDWTEAGDLADQRTAAIETAITSRDAQAIGTRSLASVSATRDNDQAEAFAALLDLVGVTASQLTDRIAKRRQTTPPPSGAPDPAGVVALATNRLNGETVFSTFAAYIAAGVGDPIAEGGQ